MDTSNMIVVTSRTVYGVDLIYPVNARAKVLAQLTGKKTLSRTDLELANGLGLRVVAQGSFSPVLTGLAVVPQA